MGKMHGMHTHQNVIYFFEKGYITAGINYNIEAGDGGCRLVVRYLHKNRTWELQDISFLLVPDRKRLLTTKCCFPKVIFTAIVNTTRKAMDTQPTGPKPHNSTC